MSIRSLGGCCSCCDICTFISTMHLRIELLWLTFAWTIYAENITAPPYVELEIGPPKDKFNCRFNIMTVLPFMVAVWDASAELVVGHGSMITYIAFVTTCRQYNKNVSEYRAHGQYVWNLSRPLDSCTQHREIDFISKHPKCGEKMQDWSPHDFSVFKMKAPFDIAGFGYPTISLKSMEVQLETVPYLNLASVHSELNCTLHSFRSQDEPIPTLNFNNQMEVVPFKECVGLLCERQPTDSSYTASCGSEFKRHNLNMYVCMKNKTDDRIQLGKNNSNWLAGAPVECDNGARAFGIVSQTKIRREYSTNPTDIFYIVPFIRVWNWLELHRLNLTAPWGRGYYQNHYKIPDRLVLDEAMSSFDKLEKNGTYSVEASAANSFDPALHTIVTVLSLLESINLFF